MRQVVKSWCVVGLGLAAVFAVGCGEATSELVEGDGEGEEIQCLAGEEGEDKDEILLVGELSQEKRCYILQGTIGDDDDEEDTYRFTFAPDTEISVYFAVQLEDEDAEVKLEFEDNDALELTTDCNSDEPTFNCDRSFDKGEFDVTVNAEDEEGGYTLQVVLR